MGCDYRYAGSATYPRFDRELCEIARILGCEETEHLKERRDTEDQRPAGYWFGFLSSDKPGNMLFRVPTTLPEAIAKWLNDPYGDFDARETREIWNVVREHPEIRDASVQIWNELDQLCRYREGWHLT